MKLKITSTDALYLVGGIRCRKWLAVREDGTPAEVFLVAMRSPGAPPDSELPVLPPDDPDADLQAIAALSAVLVKQMRFHEETCPGDGSPCWENRAYCAGFIAHVLGIGKRPQGWASLLHALDCFDIECTSEHCPCKVGDAP